MDNNYTNIELIERYLHQEMTEAEKTDFEKRLVTDTELFQEFQILKDIQTGAEHFGEQQFRASVDKVADQLEEEAFFERTHQEIKSAKYPAYRIFALLAVAAAILTVAFFLYPQVLNPKGEGHPAYARFFTIQNEQLTDIRDLLSAQGMADPKKEQKQQLLEALNALQDQQTEKASNLLEQYAQQYPRDSIASFYLALCRMEYSQYQDARKILQRLNELSPYPLADDAKWYLGLTYLQLSRLQEDQELESKAIDLFKDLVQKEAPIYSQKAKNILHQLNQ